MRTRWTIEKTFLGTEDRDNILNLLPFTCAKSPVLVRLKSTTAAFEHFKPQSLPCHDEWTIIYFTPIQLHMKLLSPKRKQVGRIVTPLTLDSSRTEAEIFAISIHFHLLL